MTATVGVLRFMTVCHHPPGTNMVSPGACIAGKLPEMPQCQGQHEPKPLYFHSWQQGPGCKSASLGDPMIVQADCECRAAALDPEQRDCCGERRRKGERGSPG